MIVLKNTDQMEISQAQKIFTDREEPQEAFERKLEMLQKYWRETFFVLNYYGIGGIGKSSLLYRLCEVIDGRRTHRYINPAIIDCNKLVYDFESQPRDEKSIMLRLRKLLKGINGKFQFPLYDAAITLYIQKSGEDITQDETIDTILSSNPWLNSAVTAMGALPGVGWLSSAISSLDMVLGAAMELKKRKQYERYLTEINIAEAPEILKNLKTYFILDLKRNMMEVAERPIVIFLDTYEKFHDDIVNDGIKTFNDDWLWNGRDSVIRSVPGIMWVIMGRERLQWYDDDKTWQQDDPECGKFMNLSEGKLNNSEKQQLAAMSFEQHRIGDLGENDTDFFLKTAGIHEKELRDYLYLLTNGTPVFLDLCVNQYCTIIETRTPEKKDFGDNLDVLISRYLNTFDADMREITYFLAALGVWNKNDALQIAAEVGIKRLLQKSHDEYINHSFIMLLENDRFTMHDTVRQAVLKQADADFVRNVMSEKLSWLSRELNNTTQISFGSIIENLFELLIDPHLTQDVIVNNVSTLKQLYTILEKSGDYKELLFKTRKLYDVFHVRYANSEAELIALSFYMNALNFCGYYKESYSLIKTAYQLIESCDEMDELLVCNVKQSIQGAYLYSNKWNESMKLAQEIYSSYKEQFGEDHPNTLHALNDVGLVYNGLKQYEKAKEIKEKVYAKQKEILGELHPDTLQTLSGLGIAYTALGNYEIAKQIHEKVYNQRKIVLGELHPKTLTSLQKIAVVCKYMGKNKEAQLANERLYDDRKRVLGEFHPDTLATLGRLASGYSEMGDIHKEFEIRKYIYEKNKELLGEDHPVTLNDLQQLANSYGSLGNFQKRLEITEYIYEIQKKLCDGDSLALISSLYRLGMAYLALGQYNEAYEKLEEAYQDYKRIYGPNHRNTLSTLLRLSRACGYLGKFDKAFDANLYVCEKYSDIYGKGHRYTLIATYSLGYRYMDKGNYETAFEIFKNLIDKSTETDGELSGLQRNSLVGLGTACMHMKRFVESKTYYEMAYEKALERYGEDSLKIIAYLNKMAIAYRNVGEYTESLQYARKAYEKYKTVYGENHPYTLTVAKELGLTYLCLNEICIARDLIQRSYAKSKELYGEDNLDTMEFMESLGAVYEKLEMKDEARSLYEQLYIRRKEVLGEEHPLTLDTLNKCNI